MAFNNLTEQYIKERAGGKIFERGVSYFRTGQVNKIRLEDNIIYAQVIGSYGLYQVQIEEDEKDFTFHCNCPYEGDCCKHVVAAMLTFLDNKNDLLKQAQQDKKTNQSIKDKLLLLEKDALVEFVLLSLKTHKNWKSTLLSELGKNLDKDHSSSTDDIYKDQFYNYFSHVCEILEEQNRLGGGPDDEMEEVWNGLEEIDKLFIEKRLDDKLKRKFIDKMFYYYDWGNSGLNDEVFDSVYNICISRDDWLYLVKKLENKDDDYRKELIMQIYKEQLDEEEKYLELRSHGLKYGTDYYDLVIFYKNKGDLEKAVKIATEGLEKGEGRIIDLLEFLYDYHNKKNDYPQALSYLKKIFIEEACFERYNQMKNFVSKADWPEIDRWCQEILSGQKRDNQLAKIHYANRQFDRVLDYVFTKPESYFDLEVYEKEHYAKLLISIFPNELSPYYTDKMNRCIQLMGRDNYRKAAGYGQIVKEIYEKYIGQPDKWQAMINQIRLTHQKKPALLDEFRNL